MPQESYEEYRDRYFDYTKYDPSAQFPTIATRGFDTYGTGLRFPEDASQGVYQYERQDPIFYDYKPERYDPQELEAQRRINEFFLSRVAPAPSQTPQVISQKPTATVTDVPKASPSISEMKTEPKTDVEIQATSLPSSKGVSGLSTNTVVLLVLLGLGAFLIGKR